MKSMDNAIIPSVKHLELDIKKPQNEITLILKQAAKLVKICVTAYPNSDKFQNDEAVANTVILWANYFADDDWGNVALALQKHIATSKWVPSIAEIRELIVEITRPDLIPPDEAWALVNNWLHNTSEHGGEDVHRLFPTILADTIEACGGKSKLWALMRQQYGYNGKAGLDKLTFMQLYEPKYLREKQQAMTPQRVVAGIETTQKRLDNPEYRKLDNILRYIGEKAQARKLRYDGWNNNYLLGAVNDSRDGSGEHD